MNKERMDEKREEQNTLGPVYKEKLILSKLYSL